MYQSRCNVSLAGLFALLSVSLLFSTPTYSQDQLQTSAVNQINVLVKEKKLWTATQQKIDSRLLIELKLQRDSAFSQALPMFQSQVKVETDGTVLVDIKARITDNLLDLIEQFGGQIVNKHPRFGAIRAYLPLDKLETIAASLNVHSIRQADQAITNMINTTEGDVAHAANTTRTTLGVTGAGVRACAMSDSVESLVALQASGDLPATVDVLAGQSGTGNSEGTALLEIIHDVAPAADLSFATGQGGQAQMAQNILDLHASGCEVIVDDISYFAEAVFQDGIIAQAVDTVARAGALYFSSAGNSGNLNDGTSGVWEGDYLATTLPTPLTGFGYLSAHDFGGGANSNTITSAAPFAVALQWNDPLGAAGNDYDLFRLDAALANLLAVSVQVQNGDDDPLEIIGPSPAGDRLVVALFSGVSKFIHLNTIRGQLGVATDGQISGHSAANGAIAVAAVDVATAGGGVFTGGVTNPVETFSSDGPRIIFFDPDGSPATASAPNPGGQILNGGMYIERQKPDITGADGVSTATPGFNPFFGTSASAPHLGGMAALFKELYPPISYNGLNALNSEHALDIEASGFDRDSGDGIMQANSIGNEIFADGFESGDTTAWTSN